MAETKNFVLVEKDGTESSVFTGRSPGRLLLKQQTASVEQKRSLLR